MRSNARQVQKGLGLKMIPSGYSLRMRASMRREDAMGWDATGREVTMLEGQENLAAPTPSPSLMQFSDRDSLAFTAGSKSLEISIR